MSQQECGSPVFDYDDGDLEPQPIILGQTNRQTDTGDSDERKENSEQPETLPSQVIISATPIFTALSAASPPSDHRDEGTFDFAQPQDDGDDDMNHSDNMASSTVNVNSHSGHKRKSVDPPIVSTVRDVSETMDKRPRIEPVTETPSNVATISTAALQPLSITNAVPVISAAPLPVVAPERSVAAAIPPVSPETISAVAAHSSTAELQQIRRSPPVAPPLEPSPAELRRERRRNRPPPAARMCMSDLPPLGNAFDTQMQPVPPAPKPIILTQTPAMESCEQQIREFRFPLTRSVKEALNCFPFHALRAAPTFSTHLRILPLVPLPHTHFTDSFSPCDPIHLFHTHFSNPLIEAPQWLAVGFRHLRLFMESALRTQQRLMSAFILSLSPTQLNRDNRRCHRRWIKTQVQYDLHSLLPHLMLDGSQRISTRAFLKKIHKNSSGLYLNLFVKLLRDLHDIHTFLSYLNHFVLATLTSIHMATSNMGGITAAYQPEPSYLQAFTLQHRMEFLLALNEHVLDVVRLATSAGATWTQLNDLLPASSLNNLSISARDNAQEFATTVASLMVSFNLKLHSQILWLYDHQLLRYNLVSLRRYQQYFDQAKRAEGGIIEYDDQSHGVPPPLPVQDAAYFPFLSYVEYLFHSLLALSHRHPKIAAADADKIDKLEQKLSADESKEDEELEPGQTEPLAASTSPTSPTSPTIRSSLIHYHHPVASAWIKLKESLQLFDRCVLYSRDDALPQLLTQLWFHTPSPDLAEAFPTQSSVSDGIFEQQPVTLCNNYVLIPELKLKTIEMYRSALRKKDAESPSLLFWTFMQLTSQQLLQGVKHATNKSMEHLSKDAVGYVNFDKPQQTRVIHQAISKPFGSHHDCTVEAGTMRSIQQAGLATVALSVPSTAVANDMSQSSAVDRLETFFDVLLQVVIPHALQFDEFSFPLNERVSRRMHRIVDPLERRFVMASSNAPSFPASYSMSMESQQQYYAYQMSQEIMPPIDTLDARPWVLLPLAVEKSAPPPLAIRAGLGPDEFFSLLASQVDWNLFRIWSEMIDSIQVWDSNVMRNQSLAPSHTRHGAGRFQHYPSLFLSRFLHLQQRVLITPSNQELESNFIRHAVLRSRFLMELETRSFPLVQPSSKDQYQARRKKFGMSDLGGELNPALFSLPSWFTQALNRASSKCTASALNIQRVDSNSQSSFAITSIDLSPQDTYFTIALKMIHSHLQRALRPDSGNRLLVAENKSAANSESSVDVNQSVHKALEHYFRQCRSETRMGGLKFAHQMLKKLQKPLSNSNIAFRPLTWTNEAESSRLTPQNSEFFFWHNYDVDQAAARSNLLAFHRRISMFLMMSFTIPAKLPEFITSIPIDVFHVLTHDLFRSRLLENKMKFSPFKRTHNYGPSLQSQGNTHDVAEHLLLSAYWLYMQIRQDCFDLESDTLMELQYFKAKNLMSLAQYAPSHAAHHAQPGSHMYNVEMHLKLRLEAIQQSWLFTANNDENTIDPVVECEFKDVFHLMMASFFTPLFDTFMKNELKRLDAAEEETRRRMNRLLQPSSSSHTFSTAEIHMFNQKQDEMKDYLTAILQELHEVVARQKHRWTMNELQILNFNLNSAEGNARSASPARYLFHELLEVHGSNVRVPFTLRAAALKVVENLLPSAEWSPVFVPNKIRTVNPAATAADAASAAVPGSSLLDDDDDEAFMDFALPGEQLARAHRLAYDHARRESAERKRIESEYWQQVRELQEEIQAKQRKKYVSQLSAHLQKFVPLLQQLLFSNMHDHDLMKKRVKEIKRFQTNASSALVGVQNHSNQLNQHAVGAPANSFAASVAALASSAAAAAATSAAATAPAAVVAIHPLLHNFFPPNEAFLLNIVDLLSICAHILTAEKVLEWKYVAEHWFPVFLHEEPVTPSFSATSQSPRMQVLPRSGTQQSAIVVEGTSRVTFSIWDLSSPLKETMTLRFYDSLLHPSRFYRGHVATNRAFADSPQLFLLLWLQSMADFDLSSSSATRTLTDSILRTRDWEWNGSTWYGNLSDFFEPREKVEAWLRRDGSQMLSPSTAIHSPHLVFQWFSGKLKVVSAVMKAYARKFSQLRATANQMSASAGGNVSVSTALTNSSTLNSSCGLTSIFFKFSSLLRHNVKLITEKHTSQRGYITTAVRAMYLDFVYAFIGIIMEECSDCLHPRGTMQSISILMSFFDDFMRKEPLGIAHEEMFKASCTSLPSVLLGLENHLAAKELDGKRNYLELLSPGFTLKTPVQKLWADYMHCLLNESTRFAPRVPEPGLLGIYPYIFHASRVPNMRESGSVEAPMSILALPPPLTKETLFEAWRRGLFPLKRSDSDAREFSSTKSALQSLRLSQQRLLRRYVLSLFVSQALGSAVMVKPGDVRLQFVQQLLDELVSPLVAAQTTTASLGISNRTRLDRAHQHYFMEEFRLLLPSLFSLLFQSREFLPCFHASTSPMTVSASKSHLAMFGNAQSNPWTMNRQMLNIRAQVMRVLVAASRGCISLSAFASLPESSSNSCQWFQVFGSAPFIPELPQAKFSGTLFLHLLMQNLLHDIKIILALDSKAVETELSYVRVQMESGVRILAGSHFRPPPLLAEAHERLMKELPRPNLSSMNTASAAADNISVRLFYYDLVKQYFAFFRTIMRVSLEAPGAAVGPSSAQPTTEAYTATAGMSVATSAVAPQPTAVASSAPPAQPVATNIWSQAANARSATTSAPTVANPTTVANIWARTSASVAPPPATSNQPANIWMKASAATSNNGTIQVSSASLSTASSSGLIPVEQVLNPMIGLWQLASSDAPPSGAGATNRAWVETLLTRLKELLDPPDPNPKWIQEGGFIRLCDEYMSLLQTLDDITARMRLGFSPSLSTKLQAEKAKRKE